MKTIDIISHWEELKRLIDKSNIQADMEVEKIDEYLYQNLSIELLNE